MNVRSKLAFFSEEFVESRRLYFAGKSGNVSPAFSKPSASSARR